MTITEFLLARIAEDEGWARQAIVEPEEEHRTPSGVWSSPASGLVQTDDDLWTTGDGRTSYFVQMFDPARILAECDAKRRIVECASIYTIDDSWDALAVRVLDFLTLPYADHPDYDPAWRVTW